MVNHNIKGTEVEITEELRSYVSKRLSAADKFVGGEPTAHADVELEYSQMRDGDKYRAEFTLAVGGAVYRAEEWGGTLHEAIDATASELTKELRRNKRKHLRLVRRGGAIIKDVIRGLRDRL